MARSEESSKSSDTTRRDFLKSSTVVASAAVSGALNIKNSAFAGGSDIIRVGMIGCGGRNAGASTAAAFLAHFVGDTPWVHLDIAGTGWGGKNGDYQRKGASGVGVAGARC